LDIDDLVAYGHCAVVTQAMLRFRFEETLEVVDKHFGHRIGNDDAARLHELTEGWPLGLQLALSAIGSAGDMHPMLGVDLTMHSPDRAMMQYDNNFGYLKGDNLLVLKPGQPAAQFDVQPDRLQSTGVDADLAKLALAHSLWPVRAYEQRLYRGADSQRVPATLLTSR
jgi:hypothetical protein